MQGIKTLFQTVWTVKDEGEGHALGLVWRSDGKVLAVTFNRVINLYNVEGGAIIHSSQTSDSVSAWGSVAITDSLDHMEPILPHVPKLEDVKSDILKTRELLENKSDLNIMLLCDSDRSCVKLAAQGLLHVGSISIPLIQSVGITSDASNICVISSSPSPKLTVFDSSNLAEQSPNINDVSVLYCKILTLSEYLLSTFKAMTDCWDDVLSEFNKKLFAFHMSLHPSNLSEQVNHN